MVSSAEPHPRPSARARLLEQIRLRLEVALELSEAVRRWLTEGDTSSIEAATARLESTVQEFKLLVEEYDRSSAEPDGEREERLIRELAELRATVSRVARSSAFAGGLLERLLAICRGRLDLLGAARDGTYGSSGRAPEFAPSGIRLKEWV